LALSGKKATASRGTNSITLKIREIPEDAEFAITLSRGTGIKNNRDGLISGNTLGSYAHPAWSCIQGACRLTCRGCKEVSGIQASSVI